MKNNENQNQVVLLEQKLEQLFKLCHQLKQENRMLRTNEQTWKHERSTLVEKNELARTKIESMISRLKALE